MSLHPKGRATCFGLACRVARLDESCVRCGALRDDSFHHFWSCPVINVNPHDNVRKSQHFFRRAKCEKHTSPYFWTRGMVVAERMEVPAAWDAVEPSVKHNSCDTSKEWAKSNCLITFFDGTGGPFSSDPLLWRCGRGVAVLDFTSVVFAPSLVFGRGGGLPGAKRTVPRSEICTPGSEHITMLRVRPSGARIRQ